MRITRKERGQVWSEDQFAEYELTYTQPFHNFFIALLYHHTWERLTWRIWRHIELRWPRKFGQNWPFEDGSGELHVPPTNVQDIRCYHLRQKNRVVVDRTIGEWKPWPTKRNGSPSNPE
jgi:hypothetical protein